MGLIPSIALVVFGVSYALIATEKIHRVAAALGGVAVMAILGLFRKEGPLVSAESAFFSEHTGVDWSVIFLLFGMMIVVSVLRHTGLFEFIALWAARMSKGRPIRLLIVLTLVTAFFSPILDNVTVVLLVAPVTMSVCKRLEISPIPYLLSLIFAANVGGTSTLIGDPPNLIIASRADLTFTDFLVYSLPLTVILLVVLVGVLAFMFRKDMKKVIDVDEALGDIDPADAIPNVGLLVRCLVVLAIIMVVFGLHEVVPLDPPVVSMLGAGLMVLVSRTKPHQFLAEVEWTTLAFFMALFVLVGVLVEIGVIGLLGDFAAELMGGNELLGVTGLLFGSAGIGAVVDNIPYTTAMVPIVSEMVAATSHVGAASPLWWAFVFGADLGGNMTSVAAGANVVVIGLAASDGNRISFWKFAKYGIPVTLLTVVIAWVYIYLRFFIFV
ncbi:MAG: ArsB/NhaD family transporter [Propionibacteriaceae bacterium]|jgi:Na+/H+ antiporter NhaD/arsenite permease-like protein|nr:ArsB/NhaD family transporter [Propionibacteriaceae bacterium]